MDDSPWCMAGTCEHCDKARDELDGKKTMTKGKPIKPSEVVEAKTSTIPEGVFDAFNELIAKHWDGREADIKLDDACALIRTKMSYNKDEELPNQWLNVEESYRAAGWSVSFESPVGYAGETFAAHYTFKKGRKAATR